MLKTPGKSRREFLGLCVSGAAALSAGALGEGEPVAAEGKSTVAIAHDENLRGADGRLDEQRMLALVDRVVQALYRTNSAMEAWRALVKPGQTVGLKVNTLGGRGIATSPVLAAAICERLQQAGVRAGDIAVWDRDSTEMERAGYRIETAGNRVQCYGTDRVDYEEELSAWGSVGSRLSKLLTRRSDVLINLPVLKDHDGAGVTLAMKNMYGVIHNPNKYHPDGCDPFVADLNMLPEIRSRMRLAICDATTAMYEGGPAYKPEFAWHCNRLLAARDVVALDATGWRTIERKRAEKGLKSLEADERAPKYIWTAADAEHRLGHADAARIAVVEA